MSSAWIKSIPEVDFDLNLPATMSRIQFLEIEEK